MIKKGQLVSYNMMIGYHIYDCFTMEHFRLRQRMTLTTKIYCSLLYISNLPVNTVKADNLPVAFRLQWYQNHSNFHCYQQIQSFLIMR
jgi:hypothetical protein